MENLINEPVYNKECNTWVVILIINNEQFYTDFKTKQEANEFYWREYSEMKVHKALNIIQSFENK